MTSGASGTEIAPIKLSDKGREILSRIGDEKLRADVEQALDLCLAALGELSRLHLPQDNFEEGGEEHAKGDRHVELAPYVLSALAAVNRLLEHLGNAFPAPASSEAQSDDDFDLAFDLVDGPTGDGVGLSSPAKQDRVLTERDQVAEGAYALGSMLRSRVLGFAERLPRALAQEDVWPLLSELDDTKRRLSKAVQGILFGILAVFVGDVRREAILPEYRSAVKESVSLRKALADLTYHINRLNAALADATPEQAVPLVVAVANQLSRFSSQPAYRTLRPEDKKAIIEFRATLHELRHRKKGIPMAGLRQAVEGFSKFLDAMTAINHREVLILHDRQRLTESVACLEKLAPEAARSPQSALDELRRLVEELEVVVGRSPDLDDARRIFLASPAEPNVAASEIAKWQGLVQGAMALVR